MMGGGYVVSGEVARVLVDVHQRMHLKVGGGGLWWWWWGSWRAGQARVGHVWAHLRMERVPRG